ncbi:hypothetical protein B296_00055363 [Ensete ventricosum]|uniref:Guanylate kinase-like domain-containing protein n=1 Tax=Ensete ventricosum TaxID=4639 RepID=A0A426XSM0_ENSVE|nr:hypothetical protein B296_00055363 [Ensete ventricosum]
MFLRSLFASLSRSQLPISPPLLNRSVANHTVPSFLACNRRLGVLRGEGFGSFARTDDGRRPLVAPLPPPTSDKVRVALFPLLISKFVVLSGFWSWSSSRLLFSSVVLGFSFVPQRPGEIDGKDYYFVTKEEFLKMVERSELLEYALVYGDYKGIPKQQIRDYMAKGFDIVLRVDIQGAATLRSILGDSAVFIFLVAESESALVKRLVARNTETPEMLLVRIATAKEEFKHMRKFDYVVVNEEGKLDNTVKLVESIIDAEKARVWQRKVQI